MTAIRYKRTGDENVSKYGWYILWMSVIIMKRGIINSKRVVSQEDKIEANRRWN